MLHLYINTSNNGQLITSLVSDAIVDAPDVVAGDPALEVVLHFVTVAKLSAVMTTITELDWSARSIQLGIGQRGAAPNAGSFPLTFGADTAAGLDREITAAALETALNALASVTAAGGVDVEGDAGGPFSVIFRVNGARALLTSVNDSLYPESEVQIQRAQIGDADQADIQTISLYRKPFVFCDTWTPYTGGGLYGLLDLSAVPQIEDLFRSDNTLACTLEIKTAPAGGSLSTACQQNINVKRPLMPPGTVGPASSASYLTATQSRLLFVFNRADITGLTGGTATDLDGILSASLPLNIVVATGTDGRVYKLRAGTDVENSPEIIRPDDYNATTNARVWEFIGGGDIAGPESATDGAVPMFDGTTGKLLKNGVVLGDAAEKDTGTTAGTVCAGNDSRLSDARTPVAHKTSHATGQADALSPADIGAATASHNHDATYEAKTLTTKGDILTHSGTAAARLGVGTNGQVLTADSAETNGVKWAAQAGIAAMGEEVANSTARLALTGKPFGYIVVQADTHHVFVLTSVANIANEGGWSDFGDVANYAPAFSVNPSHTGTEQVGSTLTMADGTYAGRPTATVAARKWQRSDNGTSGWTDISGATSSTYALVSADGSKYVRPGVQISNALGSVWAYGPASGQIAAGGASTEIWFLDPPEGGIGQGYQVGDALTVPDGSPVTSALTGYVGTVGENGEFLTWGAGTDTSKFYYNASLPTSPSSLSGGSGTGASISLGGLPG